MKPVKLSSMGNRLNHLNIQADQALFDGQIQGLVVTVYQNERPPYGLSGVLDWYFHGAISHCIRAGAITGQVGECTYFPFIRHGLTYHLILAGAGYSSTPGERKPVPQETLLQLKKNLIALKIPKIGFSNSDMGNPKTSTIEDIFTGVPLWIAP
jgi:hypothetical protein